MLPNQSSYPHLLRSIDLLIFTGLLGRSLEPTLKYFFWVIANSASINLLVLVFLHRVRWTLCRVRRVVISIHFIAHFWNSLTTPEIYHSLSGVMNRPFFERTSCETFAKCNFSFCAILFPIAYFLTLRLYKVKMFTCFLMFQCHSCHPSSSCAIHFWNCQFSCLFPLSEYFLV